MSYVDEIVDELLEQSADEVTHAMFATEPEEQRPIDPQILQRLRRKA